MYLFPYKDVAAAILVFARLASMLAVMPIFGYRAIPAQVKAAFSLALTIVIFPLVSAELTISMSQPIELFFLFIREVIVGLIIGFATSLLFYSVQMAGQIYGIQIGFGIINVIDPHTDSQVSLMGQLNYLVALLIFLAVDGHHFLLRALFMSYDKISLAGGGFPTGLAQQITYFTGAIFIIALKIGAPIIVTLFITDVGLGFMARVAPQMNVFLVGFPLKIGVGLLVVTLVISTFPYILGKLFDQFMIDIVNLVKLLGK